jgi:hypothetical protein
MEAVLEKRVAPAQPAKRIVVLTEQHIGLAEDKRRDWVVDAEDGTLPEDVTRPEYWAHVAGKFTPHDRIEVRQEAGEWIIELIVISCERNWASVHIAAFHELGQRDDTAPRASIKHKVVYKGHIKKHCVVRLSDSMAIQEGLQTKAQAEEWLANHERVTL